MQKQLVTVDRQQAADRQQQTPDPIWSDLGQLARVELTSEDAGYPVESALFGSDGPGWRASEPGEQSIRLFFSPPLNLHRIRLQFIERQTERTQEFTLRWAGGNTPGFEELVRQQYTFSPGGATSELEDYRVDLSGVTALELTIIPDQGRDEACASLAAWRLACLSAGSAAP
jgi:hypothetical protein